MTTTENVVYSYEPEACPAIRYHAVPSECHGSAATLSEARAAYRAALSEHLGVERAGLPPVIEHVEAVVHGMWVREKVGSVHRDHHADRMLLQTLLAPGDAQDAVKSRVRNIADGGGRPVVLLVEPDEPVGSVLDQMTPHDAVVAAYSDADEVIGWTAIYGPEAMGAGELPVCADDMDLRRTPLQDFVRACRTGHAVRVADQVLRQAS